MLFFNFLSLPLFIILNLFGRICIEAAIRIDPSQQILKKYYGETVKLVCFLDTIIDLVDTKGNQKLPDIFSFKWLLPSNSNAYKIERKSRLGWTSIEIFNLTYSDNGNYVCEYLNGEITEELSIYLAIINKNVKKNCQNDSFACDDVCISNDYKCDGYIDCPSGIDELINVCGENPCSNKLRCSGGRCIPPEKCCQNSSRLPPSCAILYSERCCHQLIHPALRDQDLSYYYSMRPKMPHRLRSYPFLLYSFVAGLVIFTILLVLAILVMIKYTFPELFRRSSFNRTRFSSSVRCSAAPCLEQRDLLTALPNNAGQNIARVTSSSIIVVPVHANDHERTPPPTYDQGNRSRQELKSESANFAADSATLVMEEECPPYTEALSES